MNTLKAWALAALLAGTASAAVNIETVVVGNPGNAGELSGSGAKGYGVNRICGAVDYTCRIGKYEVTAGQYCEFLNAVAQTDTYGLYYTAMADPYTPYVWGCNIQRSGTSGNYSYSVDPDWANRPVNWVSWGDAIRFANWLRNGQLPAEQNDSTTEDGSYDLNGATSNAALLAVMRKSNATWVIPSEDEWYKAAYHKNDGATGNYYDYPTSSNSVPSNILGEPTDPGNNATYYITVDTIGSPYWRTEVGAHENSESPYGTFDQGGNVWEWNEAVISGSSRGVRGGPFFYNDIPLRASCRFYGYKPTYEGYGTGFRVARLLEPMDFNFDGEVDSADFDLFAACRSGPTVLYAEGCEDKDLDVDDDVDQDDFGIFQLRLAPLPPAGSLWVSAPDGLFSTGMQGAVSCRSAKPTRSKTPVVCRSRGR